MLKHEKTVGAEAGLFCGAIATLYRGNRDTILKQLVFFRKRHYTGTEATL